MSRRSSSRRPRNQFSLHTNDLHGFVLPFKEEGDLAGGLSRISALVQQIRNNQEHVLLIDAGDTIMEDHHPA
ncbi:MAG: hypothetical protein AB1798_22570 [Spirochaetota bacterium]